MEYATAWCFQIGIFMCMYVYIFVRDGLWAELWPPSPEDHEMKDITENPSKIPQIFTLPPCFNYKNYCYFLCDIIRVTVMARSWLMLVNAVNVSFNLIFSYFYETASGKP